MRSVYTGLFGFLWHIKYSMKHARQKLDMRVEFESSCGLFVRLLNSRVLKYYRVQRQQL